MEQGVPQGSILGLLLFNLCLAQLPGLVATTTTAVLLLFADDKTLYASHKSPAKAAFTVTTALTTICKAIKPKGLALNLDKTVCMVISPPLATVAKVNVMCEGRPLQQVRKHRCLGVIVDSQLSWSDHVDSVAAKVRSARGLGACGEFGDSSPRKPAGSTFWL